MELPSGMKYKFKIPKPSRVILFLGVLLSSLSNFSIYTWAVGLFLVMLFMVLEKVALNKRAMIETSVFFLILMIAAIRFQGFLSDGVLPFFVNGFWGNVSRYTLCILLWLCLRSVIRSRHWRTLKDIVAPLLMLHVGIFYAQFVTFLTTGYYLDVLKAFTGEESRYRSFTGTLSGVGAFRPTGLYVEPSSYFFGVLVLLSVILIFNGYKEHKKLTFLTIISMFLSFSTAAIIIGSIFTTYILYKENLSRKTYVYIVVLVVGLLVVFAPKLLTLYNAQNAKFDQTSASRLLLISTVVNRPLEEAILSKGAFAVDERVALHNTRGLMDKRSMSSNQDAGLLIYMWLKFGFLGILYFLIMCVGQYKAGSKNLALFLIVSMSKIALFSPLFIVYFGISVSVKTRRHSLIPPAKSNKLAL